MRHRLVPAALAKTFIRYRKGLLWFGGVAGFMMLLIVALPFVVARVAESWLRDNGAVNARIDNVDINLFTGVVRVMGLEAGGDPTSRLSLGMAEIDVRWWPLMSQRAHVQRLRLADLQMDVGLLDNGGWRIGAIQINPAADTVVDPVSQASGPLAWGLGSEAVELVNIQLTYRDELIDTRVDVNEIRLGTQFSWEPSRSTEFIVDMAVNGAPLVLRSDVAPWADQRRIAGDINLQQLDLADYGRALQTFTGIDGTRGTVTMQISMDASLGSGGELLLKLGGPLRLDGVSFAIGDMTLSNQTLGWAGDIALRLPAAADTPLVTVTGEIDLAGSRLEQGALVLDNDSINWQGQVELYTSETDESRLVVDGALALAATSFTQEDLSLDNQSITWQGQLELASAGTGQTSLRLDGELGIAGTNLSQPALGVTNESMTWIGEITGTAPGDGGPTRLALDGALRLAGNGIGLPGLELEVALGELGWNGHLGIDIPDDGSPPGLATQSAVTARELALTHSDLPFGLMTLASLSLEGINLASLEQVSLSRFALEGLALLAAEPQRTSSDSVPAVLALQQLAATGLEFAAADGVTIGSLALDQPRLAVVRNDEGGFDRITRTLAAFDMDAQGYAEAQSQIADTPVGDGDLALVENPATDTVLPGDKTDMGAEEPAPGDSLNVMIGSLRLTGDEFLSFQDLSVTPPVSFNLTTMDLSISGIDTSGDQPMDLSFATGNGDLSLMVNGNVNPFAQSLRVGLDVTVSGLDLPRFSPYVPGYNIDRGRLGTQTTVAIDGDALDVRNELVVERLTLSGKAAEGNDFLAQGMAMPLDVALDLLRDGDDRIALSIPVTGSLSDPQFGTQDIVRVAMQRALQNAAMSYVRNALQPLGTILLVGNLAAQASRPRFDPIEMTPGEAGLSDTGREYLTKIGELLTERPALQLTMCGVATSADRQAMMDAAVQARLAAQGEAAQPALQTAQGAGASGNPVTESAARAADLLGLLTGATAAEPPALADPAAPEELPLPQVSDQALLELAAQRTRAVTGYLIDDNGIARDRLFNCREIIETSSEDGPRVDITL